MARPLAAWRGRPLLRRAASGQGHQSSVHLRECDAVSLCSSPPLRLGLRLSSWPCTLPFGKGPRLGALFRRLNISWTKVNGPEPSNRLARSSRKPGFGPTMRPAGTRRRRPLGASTALRFGKAGIRRPGTISLKDKKFDKALDHGMREATLLGNAGGRGSRPGRRRHACRVARRGFCTPALEPATSCRCLNSWYESATSSPLAPRRRSGKGSV